jgi:hypothetical protein
MKALVVYYSRTGNTEKVALELANELNADIERIIDTKDRSGAIGYLVAGKETTQKVPAQIEKPRLDGGLPEVAFFLTHNGNFGKTFEDMAAAAGSKPVGTLDVLSNEVKRGAYHAKVQEFAARLAGAGKGRQVDGPAAVSPGSVKA